MPPNSAEPVDIEKLTLHCRSDLFRDSDGGIGLYTDAMFPVKSDKANRPTVVTERQPWNSTRYQATKARIPTFYFVISREWSACFWAEIPLPCYRNSTFMQPISLPSLELRLSYLG